MEDPKDYEKEYSETSFWSKLKAVASTVGKTLLQKALILYACATDKDTPLLVKTTIFGALGYFISPIDVIPDLTPIVGYSDDLGVLVFVLHQISKYIKQEHNDYAEQKLKDIFKD
jgi:uncharacterized membrane protein YkvA (DUF1232 family)